VWEETVGSTKVSGTALGPPLTIGKSPLKTRNKPKPNTPYLTMQGMAHAAEAPAAHQGGPLEIPSSRLRLAR
jgi:hypothetical protein